MHCPTCDSPLPVGAMFCGVCGRAVTSADVAAAAARGDDGKASDTGSQAEPPAWRLRQPPRPSTSGDAPWWVRDRGVEQDPLEQRPAEQSPAEQRPAEQRPTEQGPVESYPVDHPAEEAPPAWVVPARPVETPESHDLTVDREAEARAREDGLSSEPSDLSSTGTEQESGAPAAEVPAPAAPSAPEVPAPAAPPASEAAPVPLRVPEAHADNGPRPTSAPLWTASFAPRPSEAEAEPYAAAPQDETAGASRAPVADEADPVVGASADLPAGEARPAQADDDAVEPDRDSAGESEPDPELNVAPDPQLEPAPAPAPDEEAPGRPNSVDAAVPVPLRAPAPDGVAGDTAPVVPVTRAVPGSSPAVTPVSVGDPVPLVEPGQQKVVEHCTHCGALLDEDDIFCPECGAVVQSVALSFTGPVTPLPPEWRPNAPAAQSAPESNRVVQEGDPAARPVDERPADPVTEHAVEPVARPVVDQPAEPPAEPPAEQPAEPPVRRAAVPGRSTEATGHGSATALPELPPMPASSPASALSGLLAGDGRSRLVTDDDVDETRLVRRGPVGTEYLLQFSTGESVTVDGAGLLGRAPSPQPGERFDHLVRIADPGKSVSKTHLEFGQELGALWVSDRWSGNGTVVRPHEQPARRVEPGTRVRVARGTRVEIGEQFFIVS